MNLLEIVINAGLHGCIVLSRGEKQQAASHFDQSRKRHIIVDAPDGVSRKARESRQDRA